MKMTRAQEQKMERLKAKGKAESREKIIERGILQFRADEETIADVLDAAHKEMMPVGTLLKKWVKEKLLERTTSAHGVNSDESKVAARLSMLEDNVSRLTALIEDRDKRVSTSQHEQS